MFNATSGNDLVECPFDKAHRIMRKRLQTHLLRCSKNHPDVELQKCPFNVTHLMSEAEFVRHIAICPDRKLVTEYKYHNGEDPKETFKGKHNAIEKEENWDI